MFTIPIFSQPSFLSTTTRGGNRSSMKSTTVKASTAAAAPASTRVSVSRRTLYEVLGIQATATSQEIKSAYRSLARECHPDTQRRSGAAEEFMKVHAAYATLIDPEKRVEYDRKFSLSAAPVAGRQEHWQHRSFSSYYSKSYGRRNWETDQCW